MEVKAKLRYLRQSSRKVRLVADLIKGKSVKNAELQLRFLSKKSAGFLQKLLRSAVASAKNNFQLDKEGLFVKEIKVDQGPTLKRHRPRARGRATAIKKRTSHISLVLADKASPVGFSVGTPEGYSRRNKKDK